MTLRFPASIESSKADNQLSMSLLTGSMTGSKIQWADPAHGNPLFDTHLSDGATILNLSSIYAMPKARVYS
jgi:hypothetical protein